MRTLFLVLISFSSTFSFAAVSPATADSCKSLDTIRMQMNVISSNIANINTTRTPEGGPYLAQSLECDNRQKCQIKRNTLTLLKYEPDHPDANQDGYVSYPNINLMNEMDSLINATRDYEEALIKCKKQ